MRAPASLANAVPEIERSDVRSIDANLSALSHYVEGLGAALRLIDFCRANLGRGGGLPFFDWMVIAARDGAMTIYNYGMEMQALDGSVSKSPSIAELRNNTVMGMARSLFKDAFPDFALVRHGAAHRGDFGKSQTHRDKNQAYFDDDSSRYLDVNGPGFRLYMSDNLIEREYCATVAGKFVKYELSARALTNLTQVTNLIFEAFEPAYEAVKKHGKIPKTSTSAQ